MRPGIDPVVFPAGNDMDMEMIHRLTGALPAGVQQIDAVIAAFLRQMPGYLPDGFHHRLQGFRVAVKDIPAMLHEMATVGVGMAAIVTTVWAITLAINSLFRKTQIPRGAV